MDGIITHMLKAVFVKKIRVAVNGDWHMVLEKVFTYAAQKNLENRARIFVRLDISHVNHDLSFETLPKHSL